MHYKSTPVMVGVISSVCHPLDNTEYM